MQFILMGVSGCGKSTVGQLLSDQIGSAFFDADDFHPPENVGKMRAGTPLSDSDRTSWLSNLNTLLQNRAAISAPTVLACSALKKSHRQALAEKVHPAPLFIYLKGSFDLFRSRMESRQDHYMPASLLRSQFEILEEPKEALTIDTRLSPDSMVEQIRTHFSL